MDLFISHGDIPPTNQMFVSLVTMESIFSLDHFSAIAAALHYVLLLGQPLPEFPCTAWHISSQPGPSVPLVLGQCVLLISPASRMYFGHLRSIVKIEKSSLIISVSPEPSAYGPFLPDTCHVHLPLSFVSLPWMCQIQYSIRFPTFRRHPPAPWQLYPYFRVLLGRRTLSCSFPEESLSREPMVALQQH